MRRNLNTWIMFPVLSACLIVMQTQGMAAEPDYMESPFAVVVLAGLDRFEEDLAKLGELSGNQVPITQFRTLKNKLGDLPELDRQRPVGGLLVLNRKKLDEPAIIVMLPVRDGTQLINSLKKKIPVIRTISKGRWRIALPNLTLSVRQREDYLLIGQIDRTFSVVTDEVLETVRTSTRRQDLFASLSRDGLPDSVKQRIVDGFDIELNRDLDRKPEEKDDEYRLRSQLIELVRQAGHQILTTFDSLSAGVTISNEMHFNADLTFEEGSEVSDVLAKLPLTAKQLNIPWSDAAPLQIQFGLQLPEGFKNYAFELLQTLREHVRKELSPKLAEADRSPVAGAFDAVEESLRRGRLDGMVAFHEMSETQMVLFSGLSVLGEERMEAFLETILPYTKESEDIKEVELNVVHSDILRLHRLQGKKAKEEDIRLYGSAPSLFVGTGENAIWLAVGGSESPSAFKAFQEEDAGLNQTILSARFSLDPWLRLSEKHGRDIEKTQKARVAFPDSQNDEVRFQLTCDQAGIHATVQAEQGYFKLLGIELNKDNASR